MSFQAALLAVFRATRPRQYNRVGILLMPDSRQTKTIKAECFDGVVNGRLTFRKVDTIVRYQD